MAKFNLDNYETVEDRLKKYWRICKKMEEEE